MYVAKALVWCDAKRIIPHVRDWFEPAKKSFGRRSLSEGGSEKKRSVLMNATEKKTTREESKSKKATINHNEITINHNEITINHNEITISHH